MTTTSCPAWCGVNCTDKQHWRFVRNEDHIPANGSLARSGHPDELREVPQVAAHLRWYENFGRSIEVVLHDQTHDTEWVFGLENAFELLTQILDAFVTAADELREVPATTERFDALKSRLAHRIAVDRAEQLRDLELRAMHRTSEVV